MTSFFAQNWGNVASVAGLVISIWVLVVARKARTAAEEARSIARLKSLVEVLAGTGDKIDQIGIFLRSGKWDLAQMCAQDILADCNLILTRWGDYLTPKATADLTEASTITRSILDVVDEAHVRQSNKEDRRGVLWAHRQIVSLINAVLGEARRTEERRWSK